MAYINHKFCGLDNGRVVGYDNAHGCHRGREVARMADQGEALAESHVISFEDPAEMMKLITEGRLALFRAVKEQPGSITEVANRLHRNRSAVKRDIDALAQAGLLTIVPKLLPGQGHQKMVRAAARLIHLQAEVS